MAWSLWGRHPAVQPPAPALSDQTTVTVWDPVIEAVVLSVARTHWLPAVFRTNAAVKVWTPLSAEVKV